MRFYAYPALLLLHHSLEVIYRAVEFLAQQLCIKCCGHSGTQVRENDVQLQACKLLS